MRVLVSGGAGFIGSHLTERLLADGHDVRVLDNLATGSRANLAAVAGVAEVLEGDVRDPAAAAAAVDRRDVVFHLAALSSVPRSFDAPLATAETNGLGTLSLLLAAGRAGVRRLVFASSSSVYGASPDLPRREDGRTLPVSPYAASKLAGEGYCRSLEGVDGLETVVLRYFNVYGPRQPAASGYAAVIPSFIGAALDGTPAVIHGGGGQTRDFTYVDDVVEANVLAAGADVAGGTFNIAGGRSISVDGLLELVGQVAGRALRAVHAPPRPGDVAHSDADVAAAAARLGFAARTSLRDGLALTFAAYARLHRSAA